MDPHSTGTMRFCHVLITGPPGNSKICLNICQCRRERPEPGIGKTTVCKKVVSSVERQGLSCDGFFTEEIRSLSNRRIGFDVVPVKHPERRIPLARITHALDSTVKTELRVGKYAVFLNNFEQVALPVFQTDSDVLLVDEIGKMELFSKSFTDRVEELAFGEQGGKKSRCMLATIPEVAPKHLRLLQKLRSDSRCRIFEVRYENRDSLSEEILQTIFHIISQNK